MIDRYEITRYLNSAMIGFIEGTTNGMCKLVVDNLKRRFDMDVPLSAVKVIIDDLKDPDRHCWSIHVDHDGQHYESVIVNLGYDTGYEL